MSQRFSYVTPRAWELSISFSANKVGYLVRVECLYLIKPVGVGFCWRCNWTVASSINVLANFKY